MMNKFIHPYKLHFKDGCVTIEKHKSILVKKIIFSILVITLISILIGFSLEKSPNFLKKNIEFEGLILIGTFLIVLLVTLIFTLKRFVHVVSNYQLCKQGQLLINNKPFTDRNENEILIIIQDVGAISGIGGSSTVGIACGKKFFGLCYELSRADAQLIAKFISECLGYSVKSRKAVFFPLFKLH